MDQYKTLIEKIKYEGVSCDDRTGTGTKSIFGHQMRFNLSESFPLLTLKKVSFHNILHELLWFISGSTNVDYLRKHNVKIWDEFCDADGNVGPIYGAQWRSFGGVDQLTKVINEIRNNPNSRRHVVSAWNVNDLGKMSLPPCHAFFQFSVKNGKLSCGLYQRSADVFLGLPYNIASYATLTHMIAHLTNLSVGDLIISLGDAHVYNDHHEQCDIMLKRERTKDPKLEIVQHREYIDDFTFDDFKLTDYEPHETLKGNLSV